MNKEEKLQNLRILWLRSDPTMRKIIECRAKMLKMGLDPDKMNEPATMDEIETIFLGNSQTSLNSQV